MQKIPTIHYIHVLVPIVRAFFYRYRYYSTPVIKYVITYQLNASCCDGYTGTPYNCQGRLVSRGLRGLEAKN